MSVRDIEERLQFIDLDERQKHTLKAVRPVAERCIERALDRFYARARTTPATAHFFRDNAHVNAAKSAQMRHWMHILSAQFDERYYASVRRIGSVHARIGLEPRWYIGAYALVLEELLHGIDRAGPLWRRILGLPASRSITDAVVKAALLDMELSVSVYFDEAESARNQAIARIDEALARLAAGNLAQDCDKLPTSFASLERSYNQTLANLRGTIGSTVAASLTIQGRSQEIAEASEQVARRTESNAAALEQAAVTLSQVEDRVRTTATGARETLSIADEALLAMGNGKQAADDAVQTMHGVNDCARGIDAVIEGVDKIAFQTRVLAMNAAVEAGRAGHAGRGFAVVADLVRGLAMRAEEEAQKARDELSVTQSEIAAAVDAVARVDTALSGAASEFSRVHSLIAKMSHDNDAQSNAISEINTVVGSMDRATQQNASMVEKASAAARSLHDDATRLADRAQTFKLAS